MAVPGARGVIEGLATPRPIGLELPALLQQDDFAQQLAAGFDDCLAPVFAGLDCFDAYLDPALAPDDFVEWLATWVALEREPAWSAERRRELVAGAVALYGVRGTVAGLAAELALTTGIVPRIEESGGCSWSTTPDSDLPGRGAPALVVRFEVPAGTVVDRRLVERAVARAKPAHVPHRVEVVEAAGELDAAEAAGPGGEGP